MSHSHAATALQHALPGPRAGTRGEQYPPKLMRLSHDTLEACNGQMSVDLNKVLHPEMTFVAEIRFTFSKLTRTHRRRCYVNVRLTNCSVAVPSQTFRTALSFEMVPPCKLSRKELQISFRMHTYHQSRTSRAEPKLRLKEYSKICE